MCVRAVFCESLVATTFLLLASQATGQTAEDPRWAALQLIADYVNETCQRPGFAGRSTTVEGKAEISASLRGLSRLIVETGGEISANVENVTFDGLAQNDIPAALASGNECSVRLNELLIPVFLPSHTPGQYQRPVEDGSNLPITPNQGLAKYAYVGLYGALEWHNYVYPSAEACLQSDFSGYGNCRRVPDILFCYYRRWKNQLPEPVCFWTVEECDYDFDRSQDNISLAQRPERKPLTPPGGRTLLTPPGEGVASFDYDYSRSSYVLCEPVEYQQAADSWVRYRESLSIEFLSDDN